MIRFRKESLKHYIFAFQHNFSTHNNILIKGKQIILIMLICVLPICTVAQVSEIEKVPPKSTTVTLYWTATGDNRSSGQAYYYDIRYSQIPINNSNWDNATKVPQNPFPKWNGDPETFIVYDLTPNTTYYFALKVGDEIPNWSVLSNVIMRRTTSEPACGDIDESGQVDITDLVIFVKFLFVDHTPIYNLNTMDFNFDNAIDISDLLYFVEFLFVNGPNLVCD